MQASLIPSRVTSSLSLPLFPLSLTSARDARGQSRLYHLHCPDSGTRVFASAAGLSRKEIGSEFNRKPNARGFEMRILLLDQELSGGKGPFYPEKSSCDAVAVAHTHTHASSSSSGSYSLDRLFLLDFPCSLLFPFSKPLPLCSCYALSPCE